MNIQRLILLGALAALFASCTMPTSDGTDQTSDYLPGVLKHPASLQRLSYDELSFTRDRAISLDFTVADSNGIHMVEYSGTPHYNPVTTALDILGCFESYHYLGGQEYMDYAVMAADFFLARVDTLQNACYFPYEFNFELHSNSGDLMVAPWYSGMAQGLWLCVLARLHHFTGDDHWRQAGEMVLASFLNTEGEIPTCLVADGYYWIDEYPVAGIENKTWTLNGKMYAMYGLYDWWWEFDSPLAEDLLRCSLATIKHRINEYRVPWGISYYCLKHKVQIGQYHMIHIEQLTFMGGISGDNYFTDVADLFQQDYAE